MDSNQPMDLASLLLPNENEEQSVNQMNQTPNVTGPSLDLQLPSVWDTTALVNDLGLATSPSTAPGTMSLKSFAHSSPPSTAPTSLSMNPLATQRAKHAYPGSAFPARQSAQREGHERKRSRLDADPNPFDLIDYWIKFDKEEPVPGAPEGAGRSAWDPSTGEGFQSTQRSANIPQASSSRTQPDLFTSEQYLEDSALDNALSEEDEDLSSINLADQLSKMDSLPPSEIPPREGLYSTPLSWEQPQPGLRMDPLIGLNSVMTEAERRRLIAIAMSPGPSMGGLGSNINLGYGENDTGFGSTGWRPTPSRTSTSRTTPSAPQPKPPPQSKPAPTTAAKKKEDARAAHSNIERKYRDKLKDKIAELRDVVPSLQTISEAEGDGDGDSGGESLRPAKPKISKGTILVKATEYIHQLEKTNREMSLRNQELSRRLQAFRQVLTPTIPPAFQAPDYSRSLFDPRGFC